MPRDSISKCPCYGIGTTTESAIFASGCWSDPYLLSQCSHVPHRNSAHRTLNTSKIYMTWAQHGHSLPSPLQPAAASRRRAPRVSLSLRVSLSHVRNPPS
eukprot:3229930-Rhodomonas_salina.1